MKKLLAALLCLTLLLSCSAALASSDAPTVQYDSTREFIKWLENNDVEYTLSGVDDDGDERISFVYDDLVFTYFFYDSLKCTAMYCWNLISYTPNNFEDVLEVCNTLNNDYRYVKFYCDTNDNTVTAQADMIYRNYNIDAVMGEATEHMASVIHSGLDELAAFEQ